MQAVVHTSAIDVPNLAVDNQVNVVVVGLEIRYVSAEYILVVEYMSCSSCQLTVAACIADHRLSLLFDVRQVD